MKSEWRTTSQRLRQFNCSLNGSRFQMLHSLWWFILPFHLFSHHLQHNIQRICVPYLHHCVKSHMQSVSDQMLLLFWFIDWFIRKWSISVVYTRCHVVYNLTLHAHPKWVKCPESIKWALTAEAPACPMKGSKNFCDFFLDFRIITSFWFPFWIKLLKDKLVQWLTNDDSQCRHLHTLHCYWKIPL